MKAIVYTKYEPPDVLQLKFVGTLIEIEKKGKKIVVTIEDSEETQTKSVDKQIQVTPKTGLSD